METVEIKKGWYWSAGSKYGWSGQLETSGVGLARDILLRNKQIKVKVKGELFLVDCEEARKFVRTWKSAETMPGGTRIGIISRSIMTEVENTEE